MCGLKTPQQPEPADFTTHFSALSHVNTLELATNLLAKPVTLYLNYQLRPGPLGNAILEV